MTDSWVPRDELLPPPPYDGRMSRVKVVALAVLAIVVPFVLAFTAFNLSRTIGGPSVPPVPGLVHQQSGKTEAANDGVNEGPGKGTGTGGVGSPGSQVSPSPTDDHGGRGPDGSDSSGHGSGDDSSRSGSSGSGGPGSGGSGDD
jgi:hypothetical protein